MPYKNQGGFVNRLLADPFLNVGLGLLSQSGPSLTPVNPWSGVQRGLLASAQARAFQQEALQRQMEMEQAQAFRQTQMDNYLHGQKMSEKAQGVAERAQDLAEEKFKAGVGGPEDPSAVREWIFFNSLSAENKKAYLSLKRAQQWLDVGNAQVAPDPTNPGGAPVASIAIEPSPDNDPKLRGDIAAATARGAIEGEKEATADETLQDKQNIISAGREVLNDPAFDSIFGAVEGRSGALPLTTIEGTDYLETWQAKEDAIKRVQNFVKRLGISAREKMQGSGQISDYEARMLLEAETLLSQPRTLSDKAARDELEKILANLEAGYEKYKTKYSGQDIGIYKATPAASPGVMDLGDGVSVRPK